jgi:hypothetical protein
VKHAKHAQIWERKMMDRDEIDEIKQRIDLLALIGSDTRLELVASPEGGEYAGDCPFCGGRDRFRVQPNACPPGWICWQCSKVSRAADRWLDVFVYWQKRYNCDFTTAYQWLKLIVRFGEISHREATISEPVPEEPSSFPESVTSLFARLNDAGVTLRLTTNGKIMAKPKANITPYLQAAIKRYRDDLLYVLRAKHKLEKPRSEPWGEQVVLLSEVAEEN